GRRNHHLRARRALPARVPGRHRGRAAPRRQPRVPGRRAQARRAAGPRAGCIAAAAEPGGPGGPGEPGFGIRYSGFGTGARAGPRRAGRRGRRFRRCPSRRAPLFRIPNPESRIPAGSTGAGPMTRPRRAWLLPVSVVLALLLGLLPLPALLQPLRPYWLALVVAFWVIE